MSLFKKIHFKRTCTLDKISKIFCTWNPAFFNLFCISNGRCCYSIPFHFFLFFSKIKNCCFLPFSLLFPSTFLSLKKQRVEGNSNFAISFYFFFFDYYSLPFFAFSDATHPPLCWRNTWMIPNIPVQTWHRHQTWVRSPTKLTKYNSRVYQIRYEVDSLNSLEMRQPINSGLWNLLDRYISSDLQTSCCAFLFNSTTCPSYYRYKLFVKKACRGLFYFRWNVRHNSYNLFATSKNEFSNSPI